MRFLVLATTLVATASHAAPSKKTLCVFDPSGKNGDIYQQAKDYRTAALGFGVDFSMKPYTDERTAAEDFKARRCDAVMITGSRARAFTKFSATLEAIGALGTYEELRSVLKLLARPQAQKLLKKGAYHTVAIMPGGAAHLFVRDKAIRTAEDLAGRRVATLDFDRAATYMVKRVGASLVPADVGTFAGMFNNGSVDACYAPAMAYKPLELHKGVGSKGGVINYPLAQVTFQVLVHADGGFPEDFGVKSQEYVLSKYGTMLRTIKRAEKTIPQKLWIEVPEADQKRYEALMRDVRVELRDQQKLYDGTMLTLMRRVRCKKDPARGECADKKE